jgi:Domain of unknown function (DUF4145)
MLIKKVKNYCSFCGHETNHDIVGKHEESVDPDIYHCMTQHAVVQCCGCDNVSFRKVFHDYENAFPDDNGEWDHPIKVDVYPKKSKGTLDLSDAPEIVSDIYSEACNAFRDESHTLAGIGFRATIEAICNDQKINGKELSTRINNLSAKGLISKKDSLRLHSIRFLGNDAAHDIKKPTVRVLDAALIIIEHLLTTVYILDSKTKGKLDEVIEEYQRFEKLLESKLSIFSVGDEFPISKFLGKDIRLLNGSTKRLETQLIAEIGKGSFKMLTMGKKAKFLDSKDDLQHFQLIA